MACLSLSRYDFDLSFSFLIFRCRRFLFGHYATTHCQVRSFLYLKTLCGKEKQIMLFEEIVLFFLANRLTNQKELNFDFNLSNLPSILNLIEYQSLPPPHFYLVDFETKIPLKTVCHLSPIVFFVFSLLYQMPRELD